MSAIILFQDPVSAGFPSPATDFEDISLNLHDHIVHHPQSTFFLRVSGDSMSGAGIFHRDLVVVDRSISPKPNHIVIASIDGQFTIKRLVTQANQWFLQPENTRYLPIKLPHDHCIWGVVTHTVRQHIT